MDSISEFITILEADHRISASTLNAYKNDLNQFIEYR
jgi:site-specific recombinase XerD